MKAFFKQYMAEYLKSNGINIHEIDYKRSKNYAKVKRERIFCGNDGFMTIEEYIERYLLEKYKVAYTYESIYDMGNPHELAGDKCQESALAREILTKMSLVDENDIEAEIEDFVKGLNRQGGLKWRLEKHLDFNIKLFDVINHRQQGELCKIIYFFYMLEHRYFPNTNVLELLSKPSMENIDNSFLKWKTWHGSVIKEIKESLEKELSPCAKNNIKGAVSYIVSEWDMYIDKVLITMDFMAEAGYEFNFENIINSLKSAPMHVNKKAREDNLSPIELLYLKVVQHEHIGRIKDKLHINKLLPQADYCVPLDLIKEMKELYNRKVEINGTEKYISDKAAVIAKYIYLKLDTNKEEHRRIRYHKKKVPKILEFCSRARLKTNKEDIVTELWIISCLQAIISDSGNEIFDYAFYSYESKSRRKQHVLGALKGDKPPCDALQIYWVRKVLDHWYANIGRYNERVKLRKLENACDNILLEILKCQNIGEMLQLHSLYYNNL
jgi:hypothetical protein